MIRIDKIELNNFRFFVDETINNSFEIEGEDFLVYGENGSGKSSIFKAFDFLTKRDIPLAEFNKNINIFENDNTYIEFSFTNEEILRIDCDHLSLGRDYPYISTMSVVNPLLDYKNLLHISYEKEENRGTDRKKNLYSFFEAILANYPISGNRVLSELEDEEYFENFKNIIRNELFESINLFIDKFEQNFKLTNVEFSGFGRKVFLDIDYFDRPVEIFHNFLNEARLTALAISIYLAIIKKQYDLLESDSLKILVLDDLLISLDMNNRLRLIDVLKSEFSDFQIFFFTHDKALFDIFKEKKEWKSYEIYVDNSGDFEKPFIKKSLNYFESAKKHFDEHDYPACANYLRKEVERIKKIVNQSEIDGVPVDRSIQIVKKLVNSNDFTNFSRPSSTTNECIGRIRGKLIGIKNNLDNAREPSVEINIQEINGILHRILHPQSHDDTSRPLYKKELEEAIYIINRLRNRFL
jgi:wobble nucleotide-excising tRNase